MAKFLKLILYASLDFIYTGYITQSALNYLFSACEEPLAKYFGDSHRSLGKTKEN